MGCIVYGEGGAIHTLPSPPGWLGVVCVSLFVCLFVCLALGGDGDRDGHGDSDNVDGDGDVNGADGERGWGLVGDAESMVTGIAIGTP